MSPSPSPARPAVRHLLSLADLSDLELEAVLALAARAAQMPRGEGLQGQVLGLAFMNPSVRTLAASQAAMSQLGGGSFVISPGSTSWQLEVRPGVVMDGAAAEHISEAFAVLSSYADVLGIRCFAGGMDLAEDLREPVLRAAARVSSCPLINLESAVDHPTQALADWKSLDELGVPRDGRLVLSWAPHPKPLPLAVPAAVLRMAARRGMDVTVLRPEPFALPAPIMDEARRIAAGTGARVSETDSRTQAMEGAHVLYAKSWQSPRFYGDAGGDRQAREAATGWRIEEGWFRGAAPGAHFFHCLPVRRGVVVADEVLDGPRSRVLLQAANRLPIMKALLLTLSGQGGHAPTAR